MTENVEVKLHDYTGTIVINRPEKRNALSRAVLKEISEALFDLHGEKKVRAVVLTGAGSAFCAGMDLDEMRATAQEDNAQEMWRRDAHQYEELIETMLRFPKPLIAAVNGPAMAGGVGLALACDMAVASTSATLGLPEPRRGLVAGIVAPLVAFRAGGGNAGRLLMSAATVSADEAYRMGIYQKLVEPDLVWVHANEWAKECSLSSPVALQLTKRMLNETVAEGLFSHLISGAAASATARSTEAAKEGLDAFLENREPKW